MRSLSAVLVLASVMTLQPSVTVAGGPYPSVFFFSPDLLRPFACKYYAEWPEFVCFRGVIIPRKVPLPQPDPRKDTADK